MAVDKALVQAVQAHQAGQLEEAEKLYRKVLLRQPRNPLAAQNMGVLLYGRGELDEAAKLLRRAISIDPKSSEAHNNLGNVLRNQGKADEAIAAFRQALRLQPNESAYNNLGNILRSRGETAEAIACYEAAIRIRPDYLQSYYHLGITYRELGRLEDAMASHQKAVALNPRFYQGMTHIGVCLFELGRYADAVAWHRRALEAAPNIAETHNNLGNALKSMDDMAGAEAAYRMALQVKPDFTSARLNLGTLLVLLDRRDEAIAQFEAVAAQLPEHPVVWAKLSYEKRVICDWRDFDESVDGKVRRFVRQGPTEITPFALITLSSTPEEQLLAAAAYAARISKQATPLPPRPAQRRDRIRLGYLSADFHPHATAYLMAELFERHDRSRFETFAYSIGPDSDSEIRRRLVAGFDHFSDLKPLGYDAAAQAIYNDQIDILVDLKGYTQNARAEILARRPAPVQVNYIGYPGTMGANFIDYVIADRFIIPPEQHPYFTEKVVALPHCYQPNDTQRAISSRAPSRAECGLPDQGFVFCSFNGSYKLTPRIFDLWMRLLAQVPGSVLWLLESAPGSTQNLRREAQARGIDPARLVFAPPLALPDHLARQALADLFLDTLPVNAHTTASDALWAGLPVLTCAGDTFISRVAGSLLTAIGLPELVTTSLADYEALALSLARNPARIAAFKQHLQAQRLSAPLFDIARLTRNLESAYARMWDIHLAGQPPAAFDVVEG